MTRMTRLSTMPANRLAQVLGGDPQEAAPWVEAAASHGVTAAQLALGRMLLEGHGVARNQTAALSWFRRAGQAGDAEAMNMLGRCFELGWGCEADPTAAAPWYHRSADAGHGWGEYNYANLLFDGRGVPQDRPACGRSWPRAGDELARPLPRRRLGNPGQSRRSGALVSTVCRSGLFSRTVQPCD